MQNVEDRCLYKMQTVLYQYLNRKHEFVFLMITCNFATIFIRELREGIGRHWGPEGGMMACSYTFSDMTAFALFIIFLCTIT